MRCKPRALASTRVLRVAELIHADAAQVRGACAALPGGVTAAIAELPAGTLVTLELHRCWWDRRPRRSVLTMLQVAMGGVVSRTQRVTIVASALIQDGQVLAAQRSHPEAMAGKWEFPGGKVEKGETPRVALARECSEELGTRVTVAGEIARADLDTGALLILFETRLEPGAPAPVAREHLELRWVDRDQLGQLDWLPTNRRFVTDVTARL